MRHPSPCFAVVVGHEWPDRKNQSLNGSIRTPSIPRPISFYALAGRDPEPNTTIRKEEATWSRTSSCRCGSEQFIQKENFPEFTYRLFVLWNRVIYTKLLTHPFKNLLISNEESYKELFHYFLNNFMFMIENHYNISLHIEGMSECGECFKDNIGNTILFLHMLVNRMFELVVIVLIIGTIINKINQKT